MRSFTKSLGRFSWALSLFGLGGLAELLRGRPRRRQAATATAAFDSATGTFEHRFPKPFRMVFHIGDRLLGGMVDLLFESVAPRSRKPGCSCGAHATEAGTASAWPRTEDPGPHRGWPPADGSAEPDSPETHPPEPGFAQAGFPGTGSPWAGFPGVADPAGSHASGSERSSAEASRAGAPPSHQGGWGPQDGLG